MKRITQILSRITHYVSRTTKHPPRITYHATPPAPDEKPNARAHGWKWLDTSYPFTHRMFRVREDRARWPDGHVAPYTYIQTAGAVWVVPITADRQIVLIRQFRYVLDDWSWEVPAGGFHDFTGSPIDLGRRELAEEAGGSSDDWLYVGSFRAGVSLMDEMGHIVLARNVRLDLEQQCEVGEIIQVHTVSIPQALEMARSGEIVDGHSALALLRCQGYLEGELR
jgi:ADP-ribose pyrophosphatase